MAEGGACQRRVAVPAAARQEAQGQSEGRGGRGGRIPRRIDINPWPPLVDERSRCVDLEVDLIIGKGHHGAVLTVVDRKSKHVWLAVLSGKMAAETTRVLIRLLEPIEDRMHTITAENGKEFAGRADVAAALGLDYDFARPYHSWKRGPTEHTNGPRQYWPKRKEIKHLPPEEVRRCGSCSKTGRARCWAIGC